MSEPDGGLPLQLTLGVLDGNYLRTTILRREDEDWLEAEVEVRSAGFNGRCLVTLWSMAFAPFRNQLQTLIDNGKGVAKFVPAEPWLTIGLQWDCYDTVEAVCTVRDNLDGGNELRTRFVISPGQLETIAQELDRIIQACSVVRR